MGQIDVAWQQSEGAIQFYNKIAVMRSEAWYVRGQKESSFGCSNGKVNPSYLRLLKRRASIRA